MLVASDDLDSAEDAYFRELAASKSNDVEGRLIRLERFEKRAWPIIQKLEEMGSTPSTREMNAVGDMNDVTTLLNSEREKWETSVRELQQEVEMLQNSMHSLTGPDGMTRFNSADLQESLLDRISKVELTCAESKGNIEHQIARAGSTDIDAAAVHQIETELYTYTLQESIWDISFFMFQQGVNLAESCFGVFLIGLCFCMQAVLCYVVFLSMTNSRYTEETIEAYELFRTLTAHDLLHMDRTSKISLADRVCNLDAHSSLHIAAEQAGDVADIRQYITEMAGYPLGVILCSLALLCWYMTVAQEVQQTWSTFAAILSIPKSTHTTIHVTSERMVTIRTLGRLHVVFPIGIVLVRTVTCGWLFYTGTLYLLSTASVPDLILNAIALEFILNVDELIYKSLAPDAIRTMIISTEPLQKCLWQASFPWRFDVAFIVSALLVFGPWVFAFPSLQKELDGRKQALRELCGGNKRFVYKSLPFGIVNWAPSNDYSMFQDQRTTEYEHLQAIVFEKEEAALTLTNWGNFLGLPGYEARTIPGHANWVSPGCTNLENWPEHWAQHLPLFFRALQDQARNSSVSSCHDVEFLCYKDSAAGLCVRMLCPETCGCQSPISKNPLAKISMGCPQRCEETPNYQAVSKQLQCHDLSAEELRNTASWRDFVEAFRLTVKDWQSGFSGLYGAVADVMWDEGCGSVKGIEVFGEDIDLCSGAGALNPIKGVRSWCPEACNCGPAPAPAGCPSLCAGDSSAMNHEEPP